MIKACARCGGLYATVDGESYAPIHRASSDTAPDPFPLRTFPATATPATTEARENAGWVRFGRITVDPETETETFQRIDPPERKPLPQSLDDAEALTDEQVSNILRDHVWANIDLYSPLSRVVEQAIDRLALRSAHDSKVAKLREEIERLRTELDSYKPHCSRGAVIGEATGVKP